MAKIQFFNRYSSKPISDGTSFVGDPEVCNQQAAEECEINRLLHQFEAGEIDSLPVVRDSQYNDVLITPDSYQSAKAMIDKVSSDFYSLPVETQRQFGDIQTYVSDLAKISQGDVSTIEKYKNFSVNSPVQPDVNSSSSGTASSSISRGDSEISSSNVKASDTAVSLDREE